MGVFPYTSRDFTVFYFNGKWGFTSPTWEGYPAVNMGAATPIAIWLIEHGLPYNADLQSDPNSDGVNLLLAYALNLDPNQNLSDSLPQSVVSANQSSLTYYTGNADVTYLVETSSNLQTWSTVGVTLSAPDANSFRTATCLNACPARFMRLTVGH